MNDHNKSFNSKSLNTFKWFCPSYNFEYHEDKFIIYADEDTDYWQKTHYGFVHDNGHFLHTDFNASENFVMSATVLCEGRKLYDQAGLMIRIDSENWIKTSCEYDEENGSFLGVVVTSLGYSDWSYQRVRLPKDTKISYRITKDKSGVFVDAKIVDNKVIGDNKMLNIPDNLIGNDYQQLRVTHIAHLRPHDHLMVGIYACSPLTSPTKAKMKATFTDFSLSLINENK